MITEIKDKVSIKKGSLSNPSFTRGVPKYLTMSTPIMSAFTMSAS
jgi:hypothetical protein